MLLLTTSYIVPKEKRAEHARLLRRFRQAMMRVGCEHFEVYEQVGTNWNPSETTGRFVQILRFKDRKHHLTVQAAERNDPQLQQLVNQFCDLINLPYQQQEGLFALGYYSSFMKLPAQKAGESAPIEDETLDLNAPIPPVAEPGVVQQAAPPVAPKS